MVSNHVRVMMARVQYSSHCPTELIVAHNCHNRYIAKNRGLIPKMSKLWLLQIKVESIKGKILILFIYEKYDFKS